MKPIAREAKDRDLVYIMEVAKCGGLNYSIARFASILDSKSGVLIVYQNFEGDIVGFGVAFDMVGKGFIEQIFVKNEWQRCKVGTFILNEIIEYGRVNWNWKQISMVVDPFNKVVEKFTSNFTQDDKISVWKHARVCKVTE